jgi:hypothetical protein
MSFFFFLCIQFEVPMATTQRDKLELFTFGVSIIRNKVIYTSSLMRDMYYKMNPLAKGTKSAISSQKLMKRYLEDLAIEEHESALSSGSAEVFQWRAHPIRYIISGTIPFFFFFFFFFFCE